MRVALGVGCLVLFLLQNLMVLVASSFERAGSFSQLARLIPDFIRPLLDSTFMAVLSFEGMVQVGYGHVIVIFFLVTIAIIAGTEPVGEIESKFVDLVMSRPVMRRAAIGRSIIVITFATAIPVVTMLAGTWLGLAAFAPRSAPRPEIGSLLGVAVNLEFEAIAWGAVALAFGAFSNHRAKAGGFAGLLAFATFLLDYVGRVWDPLRDVARLSPFRYFSPFAIIAGEPVSGTNIAILGALFVTGCGVAFVVYGRRDL